MSQHFNQIKPLSSKTLDKVQKDIERYQQKKHSKFQIDDLREMSYTLPTGYTFSIHRIYITTIDSGELKDVGWVINDKNTFCLLCFKDFGMSRWKHHCRACGTLICKECSNFENELISFENLGKQKVCQSCYKPSGGATLRSSRRDGTSVLNPDEGISRANTQADPEEEEEVNDEVFYNQTINVIPNPGYVVKTHREDESKVFINIYHHEGVIDDYLLLLRTVDPTVFTKPEDTQLLPTIYLGEKRATIDKNGAQSTLYTVVISSKYFEVDQTEGAAAAGNVTEKKASPSTNPALIQKIIETININYQDTLQEQDYIRPRIKAGYQGLPIIAPEPFVLTKQPVSMILRITDDETRSVGTNRRSIIDEKADYVVAVVPPSVDSKTEPATNTPSNSARFPLSYRNMTNPTKATVATSSLSRPQSSNTMGSNPPGDNHSVISDMTQSVGTDASSTVGGNMLNISSYFYSTNHVADGRSLLTSEMLRHTKELSITTKESSQLVDESTRKPTILVGWQIMLFGDTENLNGVFVVTGTRKNHLRKTEYRLSNLIFEDQWVKLRRNDQKTGIQFRPLRKVLSNL